MKKLIIAGVAVSAALAGINANAIPVPLRANGTPDTASVFSQGVAETFMTGSSAATPFITAALRNGNCAAGAPIYRYVDSSNGSFAFLCERSAGFTAVSAPFLLLHKRDGGGSLNGVRHADPSLPESSSQVFILNADLANVTSCAAVNSAGLSNCSGGTVTADNSRGRVSEAGFSDVDPAQFASNINGSAQLGNAVVSTPIATQIFGVAVNTRLRDAMQGAMVAANVLPASCLTTNGIGAAAVAFSRESEDCMPNLTKAQVTSIFARNRVTDWAQFAWGTGVANQRLFTTNTTVLAAADRPANRDIHVCTRTQGSGTLATAQIKFEDAPCNGTLAEPIVTATSQTLGTESGASGSQKVVHSMSGSGDVESCLSGLNSGTAVGTFDLNPDPNVAVAPFTTFRWAIGIQGIERNTNGSIPYRFIKIDNASPSAHNVVEGRYNFWAELVAVSATSTITNDPLASAIVATMSNPSTIGNFLNVTHTWGGVTGFLGVATSTAFPPTSTAAIAPGTLLNAAFDTARPVNPYSHVTSIGGSLNHCRLPTIPGGQTRAIPAFYPVYR